MIEPGTIAPELLAPRLPPLGYIKIGGRRAKTTSREGNEFQPPEKYDHFQIRTRTRGADGNFERDGAVHERIGDKPTELLVRLPFDTRGENFFAAMTQYKGRTRVVECNGLQQVDGSTKVAALCSRRAGKPCACKPYGRLAVILEAAPTFGGLYVFRTTSWESVNSIQTALRLFEEQFGSLRGLPLLMKLYPAEVTYRDGDKQKTGTAYKVALVLRASFEEARAATIEFHRSNQLARREILQLVAGTSAELEALDRADAPEIGGEFFPAGDSKPAGKLAELNAAILGQPAADPLEPRLEHLRALLEQARAVVTTEQVRKITNAIEARDAENVEASIDFLTRKLA